MLGFLESPKKVVINKFCNSCGEKFDISTYETCKCHMCRDQNKKTEILF